LEDFVNIDFKRYREQKGISQKKIAYLLGLSLQQVEHFEDSLKGVPLELVVKWLSILELAADIKAESEVDFEAELAAEFFPPLEIDRETPLPELAATIPVTKTTAQPKIAACNPYAELYRRLNLLNQYIDDAPAIDTQNLPDRQDPYTALKAQIKRYYQKPNVVLTGAFDAGKSHMANAFLGSQILPTGYQPATRVITIVRHIGDRPTWFKGNVGIIDEEFWRDKNGKLTLDLQKLDNRELSQKYCQQVGSFEALKKYAVHNYDDDDEAPGHTAIVYADSPLLRICNLIDLPGYSDRQDEISKDVEKANSATELADVSIYASPAKGHINGPDMVRLGTLLRLLPCPENESKRFPTFGNLLIVATHADPSISDEQLADILSKAPGRLYKQLDKTALERRRQQINRGIGRDDLKRRFFSFWSETPQRCQGLFDELNKLLCRDLPKARIARISREIRAIASDNKHKYAREIEKCQITISNIEEARKQLREAKENEPARQREVQKIRDDVRSSIEDLRKDSKKSFKKCAQELLEADEIEEIIRQMYDNKKEAQQYAPGYIIEKLQGEVEEIISVYSEKFKDIIDKFLEEYPYPELELPNLDGIKASVPFDIKGAFLGGIAGLGTYGALAAWAATLGNLGGYILVTQLVSILSALGISITGGTAAVVAFVAAIGGPIVLGVGLAAALGGIMWRLFGESWQKRLAKQIVKLLQEEKISNKFLEGIDKYWQDTETAFEEGAKAVEEKGQEYLQYQRELVSSKTQSKERIEEIIKILRELRDFFGEIPWAGEGES
jgi:transcriptional regulator with XRE-family HTH domain